MNKHSPISPSSYIRAKNCAGSVHLIPLFNQAFGEQDSEEATEGTLVHEYARLHLCKQPEDAPEISDNLRKVAQGYMAYCAQHALRHERIEQQVSLAPYIPNGLGTPDFVTWDENTIKVIDLKAGVGVRVSPIENPQLKLYALGAIESHKIKDKPDMRLELHIYQPRINNIEMWHTTLEKVWQWADLEVAQTVQRVEMLNPSPVACQFCDVKPLCPAHITLARKAQEYSKEPTIDELGDALRLANILAPWAKKVQELARSQATNEGLIPDGFTLADGKSSRSWDDGGQALVQKLGDDAYKRDLLSVAYVQKHHPEVYAELSDHIRTTQGKPLLKEEK